MSWLLLLLLLFLLRFGRKIVEKKFRRYISSSFFFFFAFASFILMSAQWKAFIPKEKEEIILWMIWKMKSKRSRRIWEANGHWYGSSMHLNNGHAINSITTTTTKKRCYIKRAAKRRRRTRERVERYTNWIMFVYVHIMLWLSNSKEPWCYKSVICKLIRTWFHSQYFKCNFDIILLFHCWNVSMLLAMKSVLQL